MAVEVADILKIVARMRLNGIGDIVNTYHFIVAVNDLVDDDAVMDGVATIMNTLYTKIVSQISPLVDFESIEGLNVSKTELLPGKDWPSLTAGTNSSTMLPEMNAACCFFRTITPRVRAAKYLPPFGENTQDDGELGATAVTAIEDFGDFLVDPISITDLQLGYISFNRVTSFATAITSRVVPVRFRTQRRRRLGVGS